MTAGLTGRCCAGKDTVARVFLSRGWTVIDVDRIGHQALEEKAEEILRLFGPQAGDGSGGVDRRKLGAMVFSDPGKLERLEAVVHPWMAERVRTLASEAENRGEQVLLNAALLEKMGLHAICSAVILVKAPMPARLLRAMRRDGLPLCAVLRRFASQRAIGAKRLGKTVDMYSINNIGPVSGLEAKAASLEERLMAGSSRQGQ